MSLVLNAGSPEVVSSGNANERARICHQHSMRSEVNAFERLIQITQSNDRLTCELRRVERRIEQAIAYVSEPHSALNLGAALLSHARQKQARILAELRSNRLEALRLLAGRKEHTTS